MSGISSDNGNQDYSILELLEEAKNDPSWEPDPEKRAELTTQLKRAISYV